MDDQSVVSLLFFLVLYLLVGLLLVWLVRKPRAAAKPDVEDDVYMEPGSMGKRPNYRAIALLDQVDAHIHRMDEQEMDELIEEMQMRGW